ncbi:HMG-Y-related protein A-like [Ananas comosus]|uniref:HMG-Y-related protein A-like n=1 Tax=Ananas comosus TaxID=4615 RepID=A0A6P5EP14_ANACO|nr:HMG-Y-related protein A-like [Ananas comosus]
MATSTPTDEAASPHPGSYPQMIMDALATSTLDGAEGLPRSAISKHVDAARGGDLSPSHDASLGAHLARMVEDGEIVRMPNGNYAPSAAADDAGAPPRRGRGRPPKPKAPGPRRPRGRPPKPRDPLAPAKVSRPRGRPPKNGAASTEAAETAEDGAGAKRPRGRPPKVRPQFAEVGFV